MSPKKKKTTATTSSGWTGDTVITAATVEEEATKDAETINAEAPIEEASNVEDLAADLVATVIRSALCAASQVIGQQNIQSRKGRTDKIAGAGMLKILTKDRLERILRLSSWTSRASTSEHGTKDLKASKHGSKPLKTRIMARNRSNI